MSAKKTVQPGTILGLGNPLLDISANVDQAFYDKYDLKPASACLAEDKHKGIYEDIVNNHSDVVYIAGGATQNSCRIAQTLLGPSNRGACRFIGGVGKDSYAEELTKACNAVGMVPFYHVDESTPTGTCAVAVLDNERSLCANLAAANTFKKAHIDTPEIAKVIEEAQLYYISSFFLTVPEGPETLLQVAKHIESKPESNKKFVMNLGAEFLMQFFQAQFQVALQYVDIVFGNETEIAAFAKATNHPNPEDQVSVARALASAPKVTPGPRMAVITNGPGSTIVVMGDEVKTFPVPKLDKSRIVDTNGAGDAFVGGFLAHHVRGAPLAVCVQAGHAASRNCIQQSGCVLGEPEESVFNQILIQAAHDGVEIDQVSVAFTLGFHAGAAKRLESQK